jgi:hypothetical protein
MNTPANDNEDKSDWSDWSTILRHAHGFGRSTSQPRKNMWAIDFKPNGFFRLENGLHMHDIVNRRASSGHAPFSTVLYSRFDGETMRVFCNNKKTLETLFRYVGFWGELPLSEVFPVTRDQREGVGVEPPFQSCNQYPRSAREEKELQEFRWG